MTPGTFLRQCMNAVRVARLRGLGNVVEPGCRIGAGVAARLGVRDHHRGRVHIAAGCQLEDGVVLDAFGGEIAIGRNTFIGPYAVVYGQAGVTIGDNCLIAMHCCILSSNHTVPPLGVLIRSQPDILLPTKLGRDVWLGAGVTVLGGVTIGDGCVGGAGAVVTQDLPAYSVAIGVPARVVRQHE